MIMHKKELLNLCTAPISIKDVYQLIYEEYESIMVIDILMASGFGILITNEY